MALLPAMKECLLETSCVGAAFRCQGGVVVIWSLQKWTATYAPWQLPAGCACQVWGCSAESMFCSMALQFLRERVDFHSVLQSSGQGKQSHDEYSLRDGSAETYVVLFLWYVFLNFIFWYCYYHFFSKNYPVWEHAYFTENFFILRAPQCECSSRLQKISCSQILLWCCLFLSCSPGEWVTLTKFLSILGVVFFFFFSF